MLRERTACMLCLAYVSSRALCDHTDHGRYAPREPCSALIHPQAHLNLVFLGRPPLNSDLGPKRLVAFLASWFIHATSLAPPREVTCFFLERSHASWFRKAENTVTLRHRLQSTDCSLCRNVVCTVQAQLLGHKTFPWISSHRILPFSGASSSP